MKKLYILNVIIIVLQSGVYGQNIYDYFKMLPDSSVMGLTKQQRDAIKKPSAKAIDSDDNPGYMFKVLDIPNGYLSLMGAFEGKFEMCFWNLKNVKMLIATYSEGCGPVCYIQDFDFYLFDNQKLIPQKFNNIIPVGFNDFLKIDGKTAEKEMQEKDIVSTLLFKLPQKGKEIIALWGNVEPAETYKKYAKGNRMKLLWNDGNFKTSDFYWEE